MELFFAAALLFAFAAAFGMTMAVEHFRGNSPPPLWQVTLHGLFAAGGLLILLLAVVQADMLTAVGVRFELPMWALSGFLVAALGGFSMLYFHARWKRVPGGLIIGHGLLAVAAFLLMLVWIFA